jgi:3',5'-cyclic AMP phosphodiesterase CpdA
MSSLLQISDTHFGTELLPVVRALHELVVKLDPTILVLSGDVTQRARTHEFTAARRFVEQLQRRHLLVIPGNHDIPLFNPLARFLYPYANYTRAFGAELEPDYESEGWLVLGVNTTRPWRHIEGEISSEQIERVANRLRRAKRDQLRVVVTHQPVHVIRQQDFRHLLRGYDRAVRSWAEAGADIVMGGHIHLPYLRKLSEPVSDVHRRVWALQAGTATSKRVRAGFPNSINFIRYARQPPLVCTVERWDYDAGSAEFARFSSESLELERGP